MMDEFEKALKELNPDALDNHGYSVRLLNLWLECDVDLFKQFYEEVFITEFPNEDEAEGYEDFLEQFGRMAKTPDKCEMQIYLALDEDFTPIGGMIVDLYKESKSCLMEFVVMRKDYQDKGLGRFMFDKVVESIADTFWKNWLTTPEYMFWETENKKYCEENDLLKVRNSRWRFFNKLGAKKVDINYIQPALCDGKSEIDFLDLCVWRFIFNIPFECISTHTLKEFLLDYFRYSIASNEAHRNDVYNRITEDISKMAVHLIDMHSEVY